MSAAYPIGGKNSTNKRGVFALISIFFFIFVVVNFSESRVEIRGFEVTALAAAITLLSAAPLAWYYASGFRKPIPFIELSSIFYSIGFGLTALSAEGFHLRPHNDQIMAESLWLVLAGVLALWIGYWTAASLLTGKIYAVKLPLPSATSRMELAGWLGILADLGYSTALTYGLPRFSILTEITGLLGVVGLLILYILLFSKSISFFGKIALLLLVLPAILIKSIASGVMADLAEFGLIFCLSFVYVRKKAPYAVAILTILAFVILNPVKSQFRHEFWGSGASLTERIGGAVSYTYHYWTTTNQEVTIAAAQTVAKRLDLAGLLAYVMELTPSTIPHWAGESLWPITYYWIPRLFWPGKPEMTFGHDWAKEYGILGYHDTGTSWNIPILIEFYANFGKFGVVFCMLILGLLIFVFEYIFRNARSEPLTFVVGASILLELWYAESNFVLLWGNVITKIVVAILFVKLIAYPRRD